MKRRALGLVLVILGAALLALGLGTAGRYAWMEEQAGVSAASAMEQLLSRMENSEPEEPTTGGQAGEILPELSLPSAQEQDARRPMPEIVMDGVSYIGYLEIPALELQLPVIGESNAQLLEIAPCRYYGTAYQKDFVIGGHRYRRHFRNLHTLGYGDGIIFTDVTGERFCYQVAELEVIEPYEAEYLCSGGWDLSLYTCTTGGTSRVVVRCLISDKMEEK